jgi:hypothetical protein
MYRREHAKVFCLQKVYYLQERKMFIEDHVPASANLHKQEMSEKEK